MMNSTQLFSQAKQVLPGGVNSPVRAFGSVGGHPKFIKKAQGSRIYDVDGNEYIDYVGSWGPMILGHNHPDILQAMIQTAQNGLSFGAPTGLEVEMAELMVRMVPNIDMVRMVNSGTEAVMSAIRVARGFTGKNKIIKFEGCYHGHCDSMLVKAGSGALTSGVPSSAGVPSGAATDTLTAQYNDLDSVAQLFEQQKDHIAAVIIEPVAANMGVVAPNNDFLQGIRALCDKYHALLIFDEVITGFRLAAGGAQEYFSVNADIVTFGKIIGGGMPVGAYAARKEVMQCVSPLGSVYQAGTLSGNPVAMAAGIAQLEMLNQNRNIYQSINNKAKTLADGINALIGQHHFSATVNHVGSLVCLFFNPNPVHGYQDAVQSDVGQYAKYFNSMLSQGIYLAPAQFEAMFMSFAHTQEEIQKTLQAIDDTFKNWESL